MNRKFKFSIWYLIAAFWVFVLLQEVLLTFMHLEEIPYSQFRNWVEQNKVAEVSISDTTVHGQLKPEKEGAPAK